MSTWHTSSAPKAQLTLEDPAPLLVRTEPGADEQLDRLTSDATGIVTAEGREIHYYHTRNGVRFARVVEPSGFVLWLQEVL